MNSFYEDSKRSALDDITNILVGNKDIDLSDRKSCERFDEKHWFPVQPGATIQPSSIVSQFETQNVHPYLPRYNDDLKA